MDKCKWIWMWNAMIIELKLALNFEIVISLVNKQCQEVLFD